MKRYDLTLWVQAPILTRATTIGGFGVDAPVARAADGRMMIAGSHITGKIRDALRQLRAALRDDEQDLIAIEEWLGRKDGDLEDGIRRKVMLSDFLLDTEAVEPASERRHVDRDEPGSRSRVAIDDVSGAALPHALQVMEQPYRAGAELPFRGEVRILASDDDAAGIRWALERALHWIPQLGGERTVGMGRLLRVALDERPAGEPRRVWPELVTADGRERSPPERWRLALRFREPFCVARPMRHNNLFESDDVVPGGVVKGAGARLLIQQEGLTRRILGKQPLNRFGALAEHFEQARFSHLFPVASEQARGSEPLASVLSLERPVVPPLSLVRGARHALYDVALSDGPGLIKGTAPLFAHDWKEAKDHEEVDAHFGLSRPAREIRVRTEIDPERRAAKSERLFAYEMIRPDRHLWVGEIDLGGLPDPDTRRAFVEDLARLVRDGLPGLGKSDALADLALEPLEELAPPPLAAGDLHVVTLQTPAVLCDPSELAKGDSLFDVYARTLSGESLKLVRFFADQRLAGGRFYKMRYFHQTPYEPWVLTLPGSVFVLKGKGGDVLERWRRHGLPNAQHTFKTCPYIAQNGYGAVAVDLDVHWTHAPGHRFDKLRAA